MRGSSVKNVKFDSEKQKLVECDACKKSFVIGKYAKKNQICEACKNIPKGKESVKTNRVPATTKSPTFITKFAEMANQLGFTVNDKRVWKKKYAIDGGGVVVIHVMLDPGMTGVDPKLDYFSLTIQRAVGTHENFRQFMPPDAASDCEVLANEFGDKELVKHEIGKERCDKCGVLTDQFGVDTKSGKILCVSPNKCWHQHMNNSGAESHD